MVQKIHPRGVIWVQSNRPQAVHLSEKNDDVAVQYKDVHALGITQLGFSWALQKHSASHKRTIRIYSDGSNLVWWFLTKCIMWLKTIHIGKLRNTCVSIRRNFLECVFSVWRPLSAMQLQVDNCQKLLFLHQLTHNMTTDCLLNYKFSTWKLQALNIESKAF